MKSGQKELAIKNYRRSLELNPKNSRLTVGVFDGVHRGHQEIIRVLTTGAHANDTPAVVLTFNPHPAKIFGRGDIKLLTLPGERAEILGDRSVDFVITHPEDYELDEQFTKGAQVTHDQDAALKDADFVYVKNWSTYTDYGKIYTNNPKWQLKKKRWALTNNAKVMHCLPVRRNVELSDEILDGPMSIVTQQASNRVWAAQAVLSEILNAK
jgi:hypothetical protein